MSFFKVTYKVHNSKVDFSLEKSESKFGIKSKKILSKIKPSKLLSKIKSSVKRKRVPFGPRTWMDYWKDNVPVISASEEFYGLPLDVVTLLWNYVIENDKKQDYHIKPSLVDNVYHYDSSKDRSDEGVKVKISGAHTLLRVNSLSRSLALKKFSGTLPVFNVQFDHHGILRFDPKRDIIHIHDFHYLASQMTPTLSMRYMCNAEWEYFGESNVREIMRCYPNCYYARDRKWMERRMEYLYPPAQRKRTLKIPQVTRIADQIYRRHQLPGWTWDHSKSIQNLVIDYTSLCTSIMLIYLYMRKLHGMRGIPMPQFTTEFGPVSSFFDFLRRFDNIQNLRIGDDEWHKLSDEKLFNEIMKGEATLLGL
ncbi:hypothetical protein BOTCAL_0023g00090 [Botryotinia calthae]|uniref:Uncharacterized protein n=1 Tax=Botryotinia calthae TaxID=38488 RepID=A0A4Y8DH33_9HELO|nr:hypothetical protein BOTCAL_0023g00090 [Botryotinia calthae]